LELVKQSELVNRSDKSHYLSKNVKILATILSGKVSIHELIKGNTFHVLLRNSDPHGDFLQEMQYVVTTYDIKIIIMLLLTVAKR
jgi:hypothetical protein